MPQVTISAPTQTASALPSTKRLCCTRPRANGAIAISPQPSIRPITAAQSSARPADVLAIEGMIENESHETEVTKKPQQRKRSNRRPSTEKRVPLSSATSPPASMNSVARTSFSSGSW